MTCGSALIEASEERIGTPIDDVLLLCYHYDPATGTYGAAVLGLVRLGGIATVLAIAGFPVRQPATRARVGPAERTGSSILTMFTNFPFFPQQASVQAGAGGRRLLLHGRGHRRSSRC